MAAPKQYQAVFSIGAKLTGSFNASIATAQARLRSLATTAQRVGVSMRAGLARANAAMSSMGAGITRVLGLVKKLALGLGGLGVILGGFAASKIFHEITAGAAEAAKEQAQAHRQLVGYLMTNNAVAAKGMEYSTKQAEMIEDYNKALGKQQIYGQQILNQISAGVAKSGMPANAVEQTTTALTNVLALSRGVHASAEDGAKLGTLWTIAVKTGMTRGLRSFGIILSKAEQAYMTAKTTSAYERQMLLMTKVTGRMYAGQAAALMKTPEGRIYLFDRALHEMSKRIGHEVLPAQAAMADAWREVLPELEPIIKQFYEVVTQGAIAAAHWVHDRLIPAWKEFVAWWKGPGGAAWNKLAKSFMDMGGKLLAALIKQFAALGGKGKSAGETLVSIMGALANIFEWIGDNADEVIHVVEALTIAFIALKIATFATSGGMGSLRANMLTLAGIGAFVAVQKLNSEVEKFTALMKGQAVSDPEHFTKHWYLLGMSWTELIAGARGLNAESLKWDDAVEGAFKRIWDDMKDFDWTFGFKKQWDDAIQTFKTYWRDVKDAIKHPFGGHDMFRGAGAGSSWAGGPVGTSTYTAPPGLPDSTLAALRASKIAELKDPIVASRFYSNLETEVGSGNAVRTQAYMEATINRSIARNKSLMETISDTGYYPGVSLRNVAVSAKAIQAYNAALDRVAAGSNITNYATGNASLGVGFAGGPRTFSSGGEDFGREGPDLWWANKMSRGTPPLLRRPPDQPPPQASNMHFNPHIVINGNATEADQRAMDSRLRDLAKDFIAQFKAAQYQERRLSYESGYG